MRKIKAIVKFPKANAYEVELENTLGSYQNIVGGYIEYVYLNDGIIAIINEEGKLQGLDMNVVVGGHALVGPIVFVSDTSTGDVKSLNEKQKKSVLSMFEFPKDEFLNWLQKSFDERDLMEVWNIEKKADDLIGQPYQLYVIDSLSVLSHVAKSIPTSYVVNLMKRIDDMTDNEAKSFIKKLAEASFA